MGDAEGEAAKEDSARPSKVNMVSSDDHSEPSDNEEAMKT